MSQSSNQQQIIQKLTLYIKIGKIVKKWKKQQKNSRLRSNILKQWLDTQISYINDLKIIENNIQKPLVQSISINDEQEKLLFPNISSMINLSQNMSACIQETLRDWNSNKTMIGQNLLVFHKFFIIYRQYCNNFMKGQQIVKQLKKNAKVLEIQSKLKLDIQSYTIKPVQRPPKYQLLLRQYKKALYKTHPDYHHISEAIEKYRQVNQLNNQSMDHQIRVQTMIKLDKKYGGIISNRFSRQYLSQFRALHYTIKSFIYLFSDMLLIIHNVQEQQNIYKRIYLNGTSFVHPRYNFKYFKNFIFVCGLNQSIHLEFQSFADSILFTEKVDQVIMKLLKKEEERVLLYKENNQKKMKKLVKFNVLKWSNQTKKHIAYRINLKARVKSSIKPDSEAYYFIQFKSIRPYHLIQTLVFTYQNILVLQNFIIDRFKQCYLPKIDNRPQHINLVDAAKNRTKLIEYRSFVIEQFLNYFFRNDQFYLLWRYIGELLGLQLELMKFAMFDQLDCKCLLCQSLADNKDLKYYCHLIDYLKELIKSDKKSFSVQEKHYSNISILQKYHSQKIQVISNSPETKCTTYYFNILKNVRASTKSLSDSFQERLMALQSQLGSINYHLINIQPPFIQKPIDYTIKIHLLNVEEEYIQFSLNRDMYIRQILQEIATKNSLRAIYDWSLYLYHQGQFTRIDNDEKLIQYTKKLQIRIQGIDDAINEQNVVLQKFKQLKKWGQQIFNTKKYRLFMKKHIYLQWNLQLQACKNNKERYHFFINEMLGRVKYEKILFFDGELKEFCSLYLLMKQLQKMKYCTIDNIDLNPLKQLLPEYYYNKLTDSQFKYSLVEEIHKNIGRLSLKKIERNAIEHIYIKFFDLYKINRELITQYYKMCSYKTQTIEKDVLIGINYQQCIVISQEKRQIIFKTQLQHLKYRTTTFSLFLEFDRVEHRFQGKDMWNMTQLIETYLAYSKMYRQF